MMAMVRMTMRMAMIIVVVMILAVAVVMTMLMTTVITSVMAIVMGAVLMVTAAAEVGAAFRIERRLDLDQAGAEALYHLFDHVVATNPQVFAGDLHGQMAVAKMPGKPHHLPGINAAKLDQRLGRGDHLDQAAVFKHQGVAAAQRDRLRQIEQEREAAGTGHGHAAPMAVIELQHDSIGRRLTPAVRGLDRRRAQHVQRLTTLPGVMISIAVGDSFIGADSSRHAFRCGAWL